MACSGRRGGRECATSAAAGSHIGLPHGAPAVVGDSGRADCRRRPSNRSRHHKRATRSPQLLREPANGCPRRAALFKRGRRARLPRLSRDLGDGVGGDEAELRRAALRGSSSSERAKGGERRMMGQSLLLGQAARPWGERTQLLCLPRCWDEHVYASTSAALALLPAHITGSGPW